VLCLAVSWTEHPHEDARPFYDPELTWSMIKQGNASLMAGLMVCIIGPPLFWLVVIVDELINVHSRGGAGSVGVSEWRF
jgi:hypothetical protein